MVNGRKPSAPVERDRGGTRLKLRRLSHEALWGRLAGDKDRGVDHLARAIGRQRDDLLAALPAVAVAQDPRWSLRRTVAVHIPDMLVVLLVGGLLSLGWRAVAVWQGEARAPDGDPISLPALVAGRAGPSWTAEQLAGRTLIALPADSSVPALAGELPSRVSLALIPSEAGKHPVRRFDDVALIAVEGGDAPWIVVAVAPDEAAALLDASGGARTVVLLPAAVAATEP